ncbi:MAG: PGPGW domain-containing protein [Candidatus Thioglobus sp.]
MSAIIFVISLILTPFLLGLIPSDYFIDQNRHKLRIENTAHLIVIIIRTLLGSILLLAGIIMLVTPGQGIMSIILGLFLMEFPGKRLLEDKLINHDPTFKALNWLRSKTGKSVFIR